MYARNQTPIRSVSLDATTTFLESVLNRHFPPDATPAPFDRIPISLVQACVARSAHMTVDAMCAKTRETRVLEHRHIAIYLARQLTGASLSAIARAFKHNDHSTIIYVSTRVVTRMTLDPDYAAFVDNLGEIVRTIHAELRDAAIGRNLAARDVLLAL